MRWIVVALTLSLVGCSSSPSPAGSCDRAQPCKTDSDCCSGICNVTSGICMRPCVAGCSSAEQCSAGVCVCLSDTACGGGSAYCNTLDGSCETKCTDGTGCTGFPQARVCKSGACLPP